MHRRPGVAAAGVIHLALPRDGGGAYYNAVSKNMNVKPEKKTTESIARTQPQEVFGSNAYNIYSITHKTFFKRPQIGSKIKG